MLAAVAMVALRIVRGDALWTQGEGVYGLTARALLDGDDLWGELVVAQPPLHVLAGAAILLVQDEAGALRVGVGALQVLSATLVAVLTWRLTASRALTVLAAPAALLTPWAVHENATYLPELVALPLVLASAVLAARGRGCAAAGVLAALAVGVKLPMLLLLVTLGLSAARPRRFAAAAAVALVVQGVAFLALFGSGLWTDLVLVQLETGRRDLPELAGILAQAAWNSGPVVALAGVGLLLRRRLPGEPATVRAAAGLAVGALLTAGSVTKEGTGLYVLVVVEAGCLPLALAGAHALLAPRVRRPFVAVGLGLVAALLLAQSASLLLAPERPRLFTRPGAPVAFAVDLTDEEVAAQVARGAACPPGVAASGGPYLALLTHRRVPGDQPDTYIIENAPRLAPERDRARAETVRCP